MRRVHATRLTVLLVLGLVALPVDARAQSLTGTWRAIVSEVSNSCGAPLADPEEITLEIVQSGDLIGAETDVVALTEISGVVSGSDVSIGFEAFEDGGVRVYDPASNELSITAGGTMLVGELAWEFYEPLDCFGTQGWSAEKMDVGTPGDLSGEWTLTATELTESCGPVDPNPLEIPVTIQQEGDLVRVTSEVDLGQTRFAGRVVGSTLTLGIGLRQAGFTVFDAAEDDLLIAPDFASFAGIPTWASFSTLTCTGVESFVATVPEPDASLALLAAAASLAALRTSRREGRRIHGRPT